MMKDQIERALASKDLALDARDSGDLERALVLIDTSTSQLDELWKQKSESIDEAGANASPDERDLVEALAETYGVKGGILRSSGQPDKAVHAYDKGLNFEQHSARKVDNSYNLVQALTNRVLAEPHLVGTRKWEVLSRNMWEELEKARRELQRQITTSRGNDPWAAADMILIQLLLTPQDPLKGKQQIDKACSYFDDLKPKPRVYESTLRTLKDFKNSLEQVTEDKRSESWSIIIDLLSMIIKHFKEGFERAIAR
jgi:tetratricopeptide (TPR) repeat protein